ncbi:glucose-6-phosphate dehydrogenase [Mycolicibacterium litorale]|uniref:glucose-6-phosphate dehydrogenase n=1 Tax=Mycolicibacterium litorale TaxID=758802 RepID=UPI003CECAC2B
MSEQPYDFFGEVFARYFRPGIDTCPRSSGGPVRRMFTLTDNIQDPLEQTRHGAMAWGQAEVPNAWIATELFVITQHGLIYAVELDEARRALYYLATPPALFDPFVDQVETAQLREGAVVVVDSQFGHDLASARPMDAALRRILDEHEALRVNLPRAGSAV